MLLTLLIGAMAGCEADNLGGSLFDPDEDDFAPTPQITAVDPTDQVYGGVDQIVIHGQNFAPNTDGNLVFVGAEIAEILEASPERLVIQAPELYGDDLDIRVTTRGAVEYASVPYRLARAVTMYGGLTPVQDPQSIAVDDAGNVYLAFTASGTPAGVDRIAPDGTRTQHVTPESWTYSDITLADDGTMYLVRGTVQAIYSIGPEGGKAALWVNLGRGNPVGTVSIDNAGNVWAAGDGTVIHRVAPDETVTQFPLEGDVRALRFHDGYVYVGGLIDGVAGVWRSQMSGDNEPGEFDLYFNASEFYAPQEVVVRALAFTEDGAMFVGTNASDPIALVEPDGSVQRFYHQLTEIAPSIARFAWGEGSILYAVRQASDRSDEAANLLRIDTQRQGAN